MYSGIDISAYLAHESCPGWDACREQEFYDQYGRTIPGIATLSRLRAALRRRLLAKRPATSTALLNPAE